MTRRLVRLGFVVALLLGVVAVPTPPASAVTTFTASFTGHLTMASGLDYTCAEAVSTLGGGTLPCPPPVPELHCSPLPGEIGPPTNCHTHINHNLQAFGLWSNTCIGGAVHVAKPNVPPVVGPTCGFSGGGHISGFCGLNGGRMIMNFTAGGDPINIDMHFTSTLALGAGGGGGTLYLTGHAMRPDFSHQTSLVSGVVEVFAPNPLLTPGQSCLAKTARDFVMSGSVAGVLAP